MIVENAADAAMDAAVGDEEIFLGPFAEARIISRVVGRAGGAQPRVEIGRVLLIGNRRVQIGAAAEPALRRGQEARVHVDRGHVRVGHVRDQADAGGEEARILFGAVDGGGEFGLKRPPTVETLTPTFSNTLPFIMPRTPPPPRRTVRVLAFPGGGGEARVAARLALDRLELGADPVAQRFEPVARGLLLVVELDHGQPFVCRSASASAMPAATAIFKDRVAAACGMRTRSTARP